MSHSLNREVEEDRYGYLLVESEPDPSDWCIYRVPHSFRRGKEEAYTPQIVSIGPFHCDKKELRDMDKLKRRYVNKFFERTSKEHEDVLAFIEAHELQIRKCYSETSNLRSHEYVKMILRDAVFILELLLRNYEEVEDDKLLRIPADKLALKVDLLLLENQLPYFILERIYKSIVGSPSFIDICLKFFRSLFFHREVSNRQKSFKHFTHMLRYTLVQHYPANEFRSVNYEDDDLYPLPCATKLHESGVKFTPVRSRKLLEVKFGGGELRMPLFSVHHHTETVLRNIMALEQCHNPRHTIVCDYVILLDALIADKRDAQLLVDAGIISNSMGDSKALASLFNKLSVEILLYGDYYNYIYQDLKNYSKNKYNRNMAKLQRLYFGDVWKGTATIGASVLLILTFLQTINSFKQS
ncbi:UPF0481 protein At3g47200-like [Mangifera indica]|uniref:UPF0481 protein At3g47200-like n=1 Tax=Mangifera indica TaxID=29780 RepID=UPI001CFB6D16|nr:UPF0481 protein At3g47200-like [Mangifera indica]